MQAFDNPVVIGDKQKPPTSEIQALFGALEKATRANERIASKMAEILQPVLRPEEKIQASDTNPLGIQPVQMEQLPNSTAMGNSIVAITGRLLQIEADMQDLYKRIAI